MSATTTTNVIPLRKPSLARLACVKCGAETDAACNCGVEYKPAAARAAEAIAANPEKSNRMIADEIGVDEKTVRKARRLTRHERVLPEWQAAIREAWLHDHRGKTVADYEAAGSCGDTDEGHEAYRKWVDGWIAREGGAIGRRLFGPKWGTADKSAVEKRVGKDGKRRKLPAKSTANVAPFPTGEQLDTLLGAMPVQDVVAIAKSEKPEEVVAAFVAAAAERSRAIRDAAYADDADITRSVFLEWVGETLRNIGLGPEATQEDRDWIANIPADDETIVAAKAAADGWQAVYQELLQRRAS